MPTFSHEPPNLSKNEEHPDSLPIKRALANSTLLRKLPPRTGINREKLTLNQHSQWGKKQGFVLSQVTHKGSGES
jgi:hypothetical protein